MEANRAVVAVGATRGGVADVFRRVVSELRKRGCEVQVLRIPVTGSAAWRAFSLAWRWRRELRAADTVHVEFGSNDREVFWFAVAAVLLRHDCVVVAHDHPKFAHVPGAALIPESWTRLSPVAYRIVSPLLDPLLVRVVLRRAGVLVAFGEGAARDWESRGARRTEVIQHGGDPSSSRAVPPSRGNSVLFAGYLSPHKGLDTLLAAWRLIAEVMELPLVIAGRADPPHDGWAAALQRRVADLPSPPRFIGPVADELEFQRLIEAAAIVTLPYHFSSPASGVLIRAMSAGRAVIATPVTAASSIVVNDVNGVIVPAGDASALAAAIRRLHDRPDERDRLGSEAARTAAERMTWRQHVDGLLRAYVVAGRSARHQRGDARQPRGDELRRPAA